jgi:archaellum component FlaC
MQVDMSEIKFDIRDLKTRMTMVEEHLGSSIIAISGVNSRLDRMTDRVERIERCLDLTEPK